ncbi:hypothetical protein ACH5RR_013491 [Cinchona calisaya]|uniref:Transmembrane protein n=1 Tax=Cinchona calisaya TaxID=153742 RepID=A0ABD3A055_9GENT
MATSTSTLSLFLLSLSLITLTATARPCKTLFFYTTTTSYYPTTTTTTSFPQNPNPNLEILPNSPKFLTFFFTTVNNRDDTHPYVSYFSLRRTRTHTRTPFPLYFEELAEEEKKQRSSKESSMMPVGIYSSVTKSSIKDRTKDIMSVVGALLFGVGCGALTAATMFLVWSLFSPHRFDFDDSDEDSDEDGFDNGDDVFSPKKIGYVAIPDDVDVVKKKDSAPQ